MRVLVCGSRSWANHTPIWKVLDEVKPTEVIHGGARGADQLAGLWAVSRGVPVRKFPADWKQHGVAAGPIRNQQMLDEGKPDLVLAFNLGTPGTADMLGKARRAGVPIKVYSS